jgi:hypothetical protein
MSIRERPIALRSPWQNADIEPLIGTIGECLDHMLIFGEQHLQRVLAWMLVLQPKVHATRLSELY